MGGNHFQVDSEFVSSAIADVRKLERLADLSSESVLLDWGCGAGRLAVGLVEVFGEPGGYLGIDAQRPLVSWAQRNIQRKRRNIEFRHANVKNERYNPGGHFNHRIPAESSMYDVFYAYSVFSHLSGGDCEKYLREVTRVLKPGGRAFLTAFVENDVPDEVENPAGYGPLDWRGPLHCVRYERSHFEGLIAHADLSIDAFDHGGETDGQSAYVLSKPQ